MLWFSVVNDQCVLLLAINSTPPASKHSTDDLLPHKGPDMIGDFRVAHCYIAGWRADMD